MPVFAAIWSTASSLGVFKGKKDSETLNYLLSELQSKGAKILDVKVSISRGYKGGVTAVYLIIYEAKEPLYP